MEDDYIEDEGALALLDKRKEYEGKSDLDPEAKKFNYPSFMDRYFRRYYKLDVKKPANDHLICLHSNRVCVCSVAPSHPVLDKTKYSIEKIEFIRNVSENMKGKHKQNAKLLHTNQAFCIITCKNLQNDPPTEEKFGVYSLINAKLIEVNEAVVENPQLFQEKSQTDGYLAILYPKIVNIMDQFKDYLNDEEFHTAVEKRKLGLPYESSKAKVPATVENKEKKVEIIEENKMD